MVAGLTGCVGNLDETYQLQLLDLLQRCMVILQNGNRGRLTVAHRPYIVICVEHKLYNVTECYFLKNKLFESINFVYRTRPPPEGHALSIGIFFPAKVPYPELR